MTTTNFSMLNRDVQLNRIYEISCPTAGMIEVEGRKQLQRFVARERLPFPLVSVDREFYEEDSDPNSFESCLWCWKVTGNGRFVGTFPKRYGKWLFSNHSITLSAEQREAIGNICRSHVEEQEQIYCDFTRDILWDDGDFGDQDSCFWNFDEDEDEGNKLKQLVGWGFMAYRNFQNSIRSDKYYPEFLMTEYRKYLHGLSRCWLATDDIRGVPTGSVIVFNGYSRRGNNALLSLARGLSNFLDVPYKQITLLANGSRDDILWINSVNRNGTYMPTGFLIAPIEILEKYDDHTGTIDMLLEG